MNMPLRDGAWQIPPVYKVPWLWKMSSRFQVAWVGLSCKFWLEMLNTVHVHNKEILYDLIERRPKGQGLLTICNHTSCMDDPGMWGILKAKDFLNYEKIRYSAAAEDICFRTNLTSLFCSLGKVIPVTRGDGVYQRGMDYMVDLLNTGHWCNFYPEGKVNMTRENIRLKWGVGRLIADCKNTPLILPIWHVGMDDILPPLSKPYIPRVGKKVTVLVGKPLDFSQEVQSLKVLKKTPKETRKHLTDLIQKEFRSLKDSAERLHLPSS